VKDPLPGLLGSFSLLHWFGAEYMSRLKNIFLGLSEEGPATANTLYGLHGSRYWQKYQWARKGCVVSVMHGETPRPAKYLTVLPSSEKQTVAAPPTPGFSSVRVVLPVFYYLDAYLRWDTLPCQAIDFVPDGGSEDSWAITGPLFTPATWLSPLNSR
jgi:hypothetical protein